MLEARDIYKSYGNLPVLKGVSMRIEKGEIVSIVGSSGAGKSTLLHILGTLDQADSGNIFLEDQPVHLLQGKKLAAFRNQHIGFVFQFHHLLPEFTALENVCIPGWIAKRKKNQVKDEAAQLLDKLGLGNKLENKPQQLSGGEQQRVAVARALINQPSIVFADEPTGNLDQHTADGVFGLLLELAQVHGSAVVVVTHDLRLAQRCARQLALVAGQLSA